MKKRILSFLLALAMLTTLAACGSTPAEPIENVNSPAVSGTPASPTPEETTTLEVSNPPAAEMVSYTYEFEGNDNWNVIEEFTEYMSGKEDSIWYATNVEIFEYIEDYKRLIYSVDGTMVKNPTARTLWFALNGKTVSVEAGETKRLDV